MGAHAQKNAPEASNVRLPLAGTVAAQQYSTERKHLDRVVVVD
jgi:hypothetical protein